MVRLGGRRRAALGFAVLLAVSLAAAAELPDPALVLLQDAGTALSEGRPGESLETLRALRARFPRSAAVPRSFSLAVRAALALGDGYLALSYLHRLSAQHPASPEIFAAALLLADREYGTRAWTAALELYRQALESADLPQSPPVDARELDRALLRTSELTLYHAKDEQGARGWLRRVQPGNLEPADLPLYRAMRVRLVWDAVSAADLGLADSNVAALRVDGDDLWVGTWNGGVARWSVSSRQSTPFPSPSFARSIEATDRRIWVGTADGLAWYGKAGGSWGFSAAWKALCVAAAAGDLWAGSLGDGLFRLRGEDWEQVSDGELPGRFVTCIAAGPTPATVLVGTMNLGLLVLDTGSGNMRSLEQIQPGFTARNVTSVLSDSQGRVWIGTYGEGLFQWQPGSDPGGKPGPGALRRYSRQTGEIGDDWVLAICETPRALYFGTFGAGVSVRDTASETWRRFGIADGLSSLDVTSIAARPPFVFFGTLGAGVSIYEEAADGAEL